MKTTKTFYRTSYSYSVLNQWHYLKYLDKDADWTVHIWFKNFFFTYEQEFVVCNWTCLIGEFGGSLGFFLGGSILAFFDIMFRPVGKRMHLY